MTTHATKELPSKVSHPLDLRKEAQYALALLLQDKTMVDGAANTSNDVDVGVVIGA